MRSILTRGLTPLAALQAATLMNSSTFANINAHAGSDGLPDPNHVGGSGSIKHDVRHGDNQAMTAIDGGGATGGGSGNDLNVMTADDTLGSAADGADDNGHSQRQLC